jgi:hypothetical protein
MKATNKKQLVASLAYFYTRKMEVVRFSKRLYTSTLTIHSLINDSTALSSALAATLRYKPDGRGSIPYEVIGIFN